MRLRIGGIPSPGESRHRRRPGSWRLVCTLLCLGSALVSGRPLLGQDSQPEEAEEAEADAIAAGADRMLDVYHPSYFLVSTDGDEAKFRISVKARLLKHGLDESGGHLRLYFGFTQTSFWNLDEDSTPFTATDYNPELFLSWHRGPRRRGGWRLLRLRYGAAHESNGRAGDESRSWNYLFIEPHFVFRRAGADEDLAQITVRLWPLAAESSDNPDLLDFYGYGEIAGEVQLGRFSARLAGRVGRGSDRGAAQLDLAWKPFRKNSLHLLLQGWSGYGENLLDYNVKDSNLRLGIMIPR